MTVSSLLMGEGRACTCGTAGEVTGEAVSAWLGKRRKRRVEAKGVGHQRVN